MRLQDIFSLIINIILLPVYICIFVLFILIWLILTLSGIGPLIQYLYKRKDDKILDRNSLVIQLPDMRVITVPGTVHAATKGLPYRLALRFSLPQGQYRDKPKAYVCIPNGLGATMVILGKLQDMLTDHGFAVLTFDRLGVGFTDDNPSGLSPTVLDTVRECDYVMSSVIPNQDVKWIMVGPSMGSTVAQCYIATYPEKVVGFLNMDGVAYPFHNQRKLFNFAAKIYKFYPMIIWTGILRPFIAIASKQSAKMFVSRTFPLDVARAQLNQARFFSNIALEMKTMMDGCEFASIAWGSLNIAKFDPQTLSALVSAPPNESVEVNEVTEERRVVYIRSKSEAGDDWTTPAGIENLIRTLREISSSSGSSINSSPLRTYGSLADESSKLGKKWSELVVRVMSARDHDFGNFLANSFYRQEMKDLAAAEHAIHALLAKNGYRSVYPNINHGSIFGKTEEIVNHVERIYEILESQ